MTSPAVFFLMCQVWEQEQACKQKEPPPHTAAWTGCGHHQQRDQTRHFYSIWLSLIIWFEGNTWDLNSHNEQLLQSSLCMSHQQLKLLSTAFVFCSDIKMKNSPPYFKKLDFLSSKYPYSVDLEVLKAEPTLSFLASLCPHVPVSRS